MGRIFTWPELEQKAVPTLETFDELRELIVARLRGSRAILGAQLCGSVPRGDFNMRSDFDVVVVHREAQTVQAVRLFQELTAHAYRLHIPLELIFVDNISAGTPDHTFTTSFLEHLVLSSNLQGSVVKTAPHTLIVPSEDTLVEDTRSYIHNKVRKFRKVQNGLLILSEEQRAHALQKILEFPIYATRKMLRTRGHEFPGGDSKLQVHRQCRKNPLLSRWDEFLTVNDTVERSYTAEVGRQLKAADCDSYERHLAKIEELIPITLLLAYDYLHILRNH